MPKLKFFILFPLLSLFPLLTLLFTPFSLLAAEEAVVTATVSTEIISVSVAPATADYGTLPLSEVDKAPTGDPVFAATNTGTVNENFHLRGADAVKDTNTWTLAAVPGHEQYTHKYGVTSVPSVYNPLTTTASDSVLATNKAPSAAEAFKLRLSMPTSMSGPQGQYSTTVTVVATKSP